MTTPTGSDNMLISQCRLSHQYIRPLLVLSVWFFVLSPEQEPDWGVRITEQGQVLITHWGDRCSTAVGGEKAGNVPAQTATPSSHQWENRCPIYLARLITSLTVAPDQPDSVSTDVRQRLGKRRYSPDRQHSPPPVSHRDTPPVREPVREVHRRLGVASQDRGLYSNTSKDRMTGT